MIFKTISYFVFPYLMEKFGRCLGSVILGIYYLFLKYLAFILWKSIKDFYNEPDEFIKIDMDNNLRFNDKKNPYDSQLLNKEEPNEK